MAQAHQVQQHGAILARRADTTCDFASRVRPMLPALCEVLNGTVANPTLPAKF